MKRSYQEIKNVNKRYSKPKTTSFNVITKTIIIFTEPKLHIAKYFKTNYNLINSVISSKQNLTTKKMPASTRDVAENMFVKEFVEENNMVTDVLVGIRKFALMSTNVVAHMVIKRNKTQQWCHRNFYKSKKYDHFGQRFNLQRDLLDLIYISKYLISNYSTV